MKFFIIGANGGLGSFLVKQLLIAKEEVIGIDISPGKTVSFVLDQENFNSIRSILNDCFQSAGQACTVVIAIASQNRQRSKPSCSSIKDEIEKCLNINPTMLLDVADSLTSCSQKYKEQSHIINIGSVLSDYYSTAENPAYGAGKAATKAIVRDLSLLLADHNICVNSISPALMYRNPKAFESISNKLSQYKTKLEPTSYLDIYKLIHFIACSGIASLRGKDIILDYGLESIESFDLLR